MLTKTELLAAAERVEILPADFDPGYYFARKDCCSWHHAAELLKKNPELLESG